MLLHVEGKLTQLLIVLKYNARSIEITVKNVPVDLFSFNKIKLVIEFQCFFQIPGLKC